MNHQTLVRASLYAYQSDSKPFNDLGYPNVDYISSKGTQAYVVSNDQEIIVVPRGTEVDRLEDWVTDLRVGHTKWMYGKVHSGFLEAFNHVFEDVHKAIFYHRRNNQKIYLTGHSLGAALATLMCAAIHYKVTELVTFGSPRVFNKVFADILTEKCREDGCKITRYVNNNDIVTRIPSDIRFEHFGRLVYFDRNGNMQLEDTDPLMNPEKMFSDHDIYEYDKLERRHNL